MRIGGVLGAILWVVLLCTPPARAGDEPVTLDWLEISAAALADWAVAPVPGHPERRLYTSKWAAEQPPRYTLMALVPKPSESYGVALSKVMEVLAEK